MGRSIDYSEDNPLIQVTLSRKRWYYEEEGTIWEDVTLYTPQGEYTKTICSSNPEASPLRGLYWLVKEWNIDLTAQSLPIISFPKKFYLSSGDESDEIEDIDEYDMWAELSNSGYHFVVEQH